MGENSIINENSEDQCESNGNENPSEEFDKR